MAITLTGFFVGCGLTDPTFEQYDQSTTSDAVVADKPINSCECKKSVSKTVHISCLVNDVTNNTCSVASNTIFLNFGLYKRCKTSNSAQPFTTINGFVSYYCVTSVL